MSDETEGAAPERPQEILEMPLAEFLAAMEGATAEEWATARGRIWAGAVIDPNTGVVTLA